MSSTWSRVNDFFPRRRLISLRSSLSCVSLRVRPPLLGFPFFAALGFEADALRVLEAGAGNDITAGISVAGVLEMFVASRVLPNLSGRDNDRALALDVVLEPM